MTYGLDDYPNYLPLARRFNGGSTPKQKKRESHHGKKDDEQSREEHAVCSPGLSEKTVESGAGRLGYAETPRCDGEGIRKDYERDDEHALDEAGG